MRSPPSFERRKPKHFPSLRYMPPWACRNQGSAPFAMAERVWNENEDKKISDSIGIGVCTRTYPCPCWRLSMDLLLTQIQGLFRIGLFISALAAEILFIVVARLLDIPTKGLLSEAALVGSNAIFELRGSNINDLFWRDGL